MLKQILQSDDKTLNCINEYDYYKSYENHNIKNLENQINLRANLADDETIPMSYIIHSSLQIYFLLIENELKNLVKIFNAHEIITILEYFESPNFHFEINPLIINNILELWSIENLDDFFNEYPDYEIIINKLLKLTELQNATLIDFCERFLRQPFQGKTIDRLKNLGFN